MVDFLGDYPASVTASYVAGILSPVPDPCPQLAPETRQAHAFLCGAYSAETGRSFHGKADGDSTANWTPVPAQTGHLGA